MIQVGNQSSFAAAPLEPFEYALANGFDAFEWFPDKKPDAGWDESDLDSSLRREIQEQARECKMRLSVHARWQANPLEPDSYPLLWKDLDLAQALGARLLNIHLCHEHGIPAFIDAILPLARRTAEAGILLAIENTPHHSPELINELFASLARKQDMPTKHIGMCFDLGHANLCAATRNRYLDFVDALAPQVTVIHLHFHENWGDSDTHLPLFTGPSAQNDSGILGLLNRLRQRSFTGSIILEQWPHPPSLLNQAREHLLRLLDSRADLSPNPAAIGVGQTSGLLVQWASGPVTLESSNPGPNAPPTSEPQACPTTSPCLETDFAEALIAADQRTRSWREKLEAIHQLLLQRKDHGLRTTSHASDLACLAIYLRFLGTGQLACAEDGRHFRPAHHARLALQIREQLADIATPENAFLLRKIYPWLPSSAQTFQRAEPLTRIRDIAHRNDIPSDLKREIKTSLQNKLHRCAAPEDLATSKSLLERITASGAHHSPAFVEQFKLFHEELKEFFNARSLEDKLRALPLKPSDPETTLVQSFLCGKSRQGLSEQLTTLDSLTQLRRLLAKRMTQPPGPETQDFILADIGLEDFAFILASEILNAPEPAAGQVGRVRPGAPSQDTASGGTSPSVELPHATALSWQFSLEMLRLLAANLALSSIEPEECHAVESELRAWMAQFDPKARDQCLRIKATVERSRRLAETYSEQILALFAPRAGKLGRELGIAEHAIRVFCESDIRGHIIFQTSKLASVLLKRLRVELDLPAWDVLVPGHAVGRVLAIAQLDEVAGPIAEPSVVLLQTAVGDEELPKAITGIVLARELPHLSHLAVRARQASVVFVSCQDQATFDKLSAFQGQLLSLSATAENVQWAPLDSAPTAARSATQSPQRSLPAARLCPERPWLRLEEARPETSGAKADSARRLADLAQQPEARFKTSPGLVIPFGVMERALHANTGLEAEYQRIVQTLTHRESPKLSKPIQGATYSDASTVATTDRLRALVQQLHLPDEIVASVARTFPQQATLMVRSSANAEDLPCLAGAGLYTSVANVTITGLGEAVKTVWASLWTARATLSRHQAGIPHLQAHMAVLIQQMLTPDFSFVLHSVNPLDNNPREVYAEIAVGLGETLVSGAARGTPYRLVCDKQSGSVKTLAFANFSHALRPARGGATEQQTLDYSQIVLSLDSKARNELGRQLADIGRLVENAFQAPQDIEGAVVGKDICLVQSRPQQGLASPTAG